MRWSLALAASLVAGLTVSAAPAPVDPVLAAFRDYSAARAKGDLLAAEAAAGRALAASEARNGGSGSTAILALNLATTRLELSQAQKAVAPARAPRP